ncbi:hypothetical protein ACP4OV_028682 [Aristida adscensionis]
MGAGPGRSPGALARCRLLLLTVVVLLFVSVLMAVVVTDVAEVATGSPARFVAGGGRSGRAAGDADAFRSSKRRIPKGPDPIHNRARGEEDDLATARLAAHSPTMTASKNTRWLT